MPVHMEPFQNTCSTHSPSFSVMADPADHGLQNVLFIPHVELLYGQQFTQTIGQLLQELLRISHVTKMRLQVLGGHMVNVVQAVMQREDPNTDAVLCSDAALQELTAQRFEISEEQKISSLDHILDGVFTQGNLEIRAPKRKGFNKQSTIKAL